MITWRCWSKTLSALLATSKIVTFATRLNTSQGRINSIGNNGVMVPTYLFKLVYDRHANRAWAHWQENKEGERVGRPISYQELVKRTGVEFLPSLGM